MEYSKKRGTLSYDYVTQFLNGTDVDNLEDSIKIDIINDLYGYANALAKTEVSDYTLAKKYEKVQLAEKAGISPVKYFTLSNSGVSGFDEEDIREYEYRVQQGENPDASTIGVPQASKTFTYKGTKHELTPEQYADLQNRYNTAYYYVPSCCHFKTPFHYSHK